MYCTGISTGYTMLLSLQVLEGLAADFDRNNCPHMEKSICA